MPVLPCNSVVGMCEVGEQEWESLERPVTSLATNPTNSIAFTLRNMYGNSLSLTYYNLRTLSHVILQTVRGDWLLSSLFYKDAYLPGRLNGLTDFTELTRNKDRIENQVSTFKAL